MKNKEKATEISEKYSKGTVFPTNDECIAYSAAMEMAIWKDQQYERDRYKPKYCKSCAYIGTFGCSYTEVNEDDLAPYHCYVEKRKDEKRTV